MCSAFEVGMGLKLIQLILKSAANSILFYNVYFLTKKKLHPFSLAYSPVHFYILSSICDIKPESAASYIESLIPFVNLQLYILQISFNINKLFICYVVTWTYLVINSGMIFFSRFQNIFMLMYPTTGKNQTY